MISPAVAAVLLDAYADALPGPRAPRWQSENTSGLTASKWHVCTKCNGEREVNWKGRRVECDRCTGAGGWMTDPYSDDFVQVGAASAPGTRPVGRVRCCWCDGAGSVRGVRCAPCDGEGERPANTPLDDERNGGGLHPALVAVGAALDAVSSPWRGALVVVHVLHVPYAVPGELYDESLEVFCATLPPRFRAPRFAVLAAEVRPSTARGRWSSPLQRARRDEEARRLAGLGWSAAAIGRRLGVDRSTVGRILAA